MSKTNQVCITCAQRDTCQYYDPNRTLCVPVKVSDYGQFAGSLRPTIDWQQVRINAAIAAMQAELTSYQTMVSLAEKAKERGLIIEEALAKCSVDYANALIAELQKKGGQDGRD